jgi:hypothetical protein
MYIALCAEERSETRDRPTAATAQRGQTHIAKLDFFSDTGTLTHTCYSVVIPTA